MSADAANGDTLDTLFHGLAGQGDASAVVQFQTDGCRFWTYAELTETVERLAAGLQAAGLEAGEVVALLAPASPEAVAAALATVRAGGVVAPLDVQFEAGTVRALLEDSGARWLFTTTALRDGLGGLPDGVQAALLDDPDADGWRGLLADGPPRDLAPGPDDIAALFYTSGTTGTPKGVPLSHRNLAFQLAVLAQAGVARDGDRVLLPLPVHHVYPFVLGMLGPLYLGLTMVLPLSVTGPQVVRALTEAGVSVVIGVPRLYESLFDSIAARFGPLRRPFRALVDLTALWRTHLGGRPGRLLFAPVRRRLGPELRVLASGGAALPPSLAARLDALGWQVAEGYGLTETSPLVALRLPGDTRYAAVGRPVPGCQVRITAAEQVPEGLGEVQVRGPNVFSAYRHRPEETAKAFTDDGWYRTGDLGYLDGDGYLHLQGRASTLIVTAAGENVQPEAVEAAYAAHPAIREVGVLQGAHGLAAVVVPEPDAVAGTDPEARVRTALQEQGARLPSYQRVGDFAVSDQPLARTRLGKIRRHLLEQRFEEARRSRTAAPAVGPLPLEKMSDADLALLEHPEARRVWDWLGERYADRPLTPDSNLELDLGVDSLAWLDLTLGVGQRTGVELGDAAIGRVQTVRDLLHEVVEAGEAEQGDLLQRPEQALDDSQRRWLRPLGPWQAALARALYRFAGWLMRRLFRLRVEGLGNLPAEGPYLIAPNHASYLDAPAVAAALGPGRLQETYWGGWTGVVFTTPLRRLLSRLVRVVPVDPEKGAVSSLALAAAVLQRGHPLIWFPEGGRTRDGHMQPMRPGVGLLLARHQVPVVPVAIHGAYAAWPPHRRLPRLRPLRIVIGPPRDADALQQAGRGEQPQERITDALGDMLTTLVEESGNAP